MGEIILAGRALALDVPTAPFRQLAHDVTPRRVPVRLIVVHTSTGQRVDPATSAAPSLAAEQLREYFERTSRDASADFAVDRDSIAQLNDPARNYTWHAGVANAPSVGIEMCVTGHTLDTQTLANTVTLLDALTAALGIQRQTPMRGAEPDPRPLARLASSTPAREAPSGVIGHRNAALAGERGWYDPGSEIFRRLLAAGYDGFDFAADEDLRVWSARQELLNVRADGLPGETTRAALAARGAPCGIWVRRPDGCDPSALEQLGPVGAIGAALAIGAGAFYIRRTPTPRGVYGR